MTRLLSRAPRRIFLRQAALVGAGLLGGLACAPAAAPSPTTPPVAAPSPAGSPAGLPSAVPAGPSPSASAVSPSPSAAALVTPAAVAQRFSAHGVWPALTSKALIWAVALEGGYFDKYGVDFQLDYVNGSSVTAAALISGSIDMAATTGTGVVGAQAAGQDLIMVAGFINQDVYRVMARPEIQTMDDLKGKPVSVSRIGQSDYLVWQSVLQKLGWKTDDIQYVQANDQAGENALLEQGQTFAVLATPPLELAAQQLGAHLILDTSTLGIPDQDVGYVMTRSFFTQHHDLSLAVLKASIEAMRRWQTDETFTEGVIAKYLKLTDTAVIQDGWSAYAPIWAKEPFPSQDGFAKLIETTTLQNPAAANLTVAQLIDNSLVQEVVNSGFIQQVYGS